MGIFRPRGRIYDLLGAAFATYQIIRAKVVAAVQSVHRDGDALVHFAARHHQQYDRIFIADNSRHHRGGS